MAAATIDEYIDAIPEPLRTVATTLRSIIDDTLSDFDAQMWHGQPVWMNGKSPVAMIKAYPKYVTFALFRGQSVDDTSGRLEANSREMASVKLTDAAEIDETLFAGWLRQAAALELVPVA